MRYSKRLCVYYQRALEVISKRWSGLIIVALLNGPLRFSELAEQLEVVSDRMLSERLKELESEAIVERRVYAETPVRVEYRLTEKGHALEPIIAAIGQWGHEWLTVEAAEEHEVLEDDVREAVHRN